MQFLFNDILYPVSTGFWTAVLYRLQYGESIYNIQKSGDCDKKLINLLYVSIQGVKPPVSELYCEAKSKGSYILPFCVRLYNELMKGDRLYDKYKNSGASSPENDDFDELTVLAQFSKSTLPVRVLDSASLPQMVGLMCEFYKEQAGFTEYKKMSGNEIRAMYGGRKKAANNG